MKCNFPGCSSDTGSDKKTVKYCSSHSGIGMGRYYYRASQKEFIEKYFSHYITNVEFHVHHFSHKNDLDLKLTIKGLDCPVFLSSLAACHKKGSSRLNKRNRIDGPSAMLKELKEEVGVKFGSTEVSDAAGLRADIKNKFPDRQDYLDKIEEILRLMSEDVMFAPDEINRIEKDADTKEDIILKLKIRNGDITEYYLKWLDIMESEGFFDAV